ncbi:beta-barrel assembly-enhancing protease [Alteromonas oceanisediminis]|uniref:beta-barrel assembly-enhancing protease n=1 Tax=Alteromonas oceanisediminis TaxID=2836180 RepID=UPI001BD9AB61|nr:M48 family metalloprotease [Alteromonas oceanisediminis]MBT0586368.1 M48 family metalloprotease [Alteromonas oceanisediminis]
MSFTRALTTLCIAIFMFSAAMAVAQETQRLKRNTLPEIGVVASDTISIDKEMLVGNVIMRQMRAQAPIVNDPVLDEYIQDLGNRLVIHADNVKFPYTFFMINNADINAFAFYGGHIGIHTGLIYNADNESEVASVVAHEIAHVTQRHLARRMQSAQRASPVQIASLLAGILLGAVSGNAQAGMAAVSASQAAAVQMQLNYTRSNEQEADRIGITMMARAGFDPDAAGTFFGKLAAQFRLVSRPPARLLSHPLPESRIADARMRVDALPSRRVPPSLAFHLAKARITARYIYDAEYALEYYQAEVTKPQVIAEAAQYGLALALMRNAKYKEARSIIDTLIEKDPNNNFYIDAATDVLIELELTSEAIEMLKAQLQQTPRNAVVTLNLANAAIKQNQFALATDVLRDFLLLNPDHFLSHQLLSDAYGNNKQYLEMHQINAEMFALAAAFPRAIDELQHAYNFAGDSHLDKQRIRARIQQLRDEQAKLERLL